MRKKAIVIGSGAGGAMAAKELQESFDVTVLEMGRSFKPLSYNLNLLEKFRKTGLFFDERMIQLLFPAMKVRKSAKDYIIVNGIGLGGTTTLTAGNAVCYGHDLKEIGIDLKFEFQELTEAIPITTEHQHKWSKLTLQLYNICREMNLNPEVTPKMINIEHCKVCGQCVLGCKYGAKWDSRIMLKEGIKNGVQVVTGCRVKKIEIKDGRVERVLVEENGRQKQYEADLFILAAGGLETPIILERSGINCEASLFVDPVLCVAGDYENAGLNRQIPMPFIVQRDNYILAPYFDYLSFFFNKDWRKPSQDILSMMIKLADNNTGSSSSKGVNKSLTAVDKERLQEAVEICTNILLKIGVKKKDIFLGTVNAGHPGGMLPLTAAEADTLHNSMLPENLYIADATLIPKAIGNPPVLTIMALAKRIARLCKEKF